MKNGYCKNIYGLVVTSPLAAHIKVCKLAEKKNKSVCLIDYYGAELDQSADVVIVSTVNLLQGILQNIHDKQIVVVCDGPLSLDNVKDLVPLDYEKQVSYEYSLLTTVNFNQIFAKTTTSIKIVTRKQEHLKAIADFTSTDSDLIVALNKIQANANHVARRNIKGMLIDVLSGTHKKEDLIATCMSSLSKKSSDTITDLTKVLKDKKFGALATAFKLMPTSKNIDKLASTHGVQPYELRYLKQVQSDIANRLDAL